MLQQTGCQLLEDISTAFINLSFALMNGQNETLEIALAELRQVRFTWNSWLREFPKKRGRIEDYFANRSEHFNANGWTLSEFLERYSETSTFDETNRMESQKISVLVAIRLQNIPYMIQRDAENAAEPFLSLLR